jgi:ubiquitin-protein ligase
MALHSRLLHDLADLQKQAYPNIAFVSHENDIRKACLIMGPNDGEPLHLTVTFPANYPLRAPTITIDSSVRHSNVFTDYICASILNTTEDWTPAYTMKAIAIQLLSFFSSENLEQVGYSSASSTYAVNLNRYRLADGNLKAQGGTVQCNVCGYDRPHSLYQASDPAAWKAWAVGMRSRFGFSFSAGEVQTRPVSPVPPAPRVVDPMDVDYDEAFPSIVQSPNSNVTASSHRKEASISQEAAVEHVIAVPALPEGSPAQAVGEDTSPASGPIDNLPAELLVAICDRMDDETLMTFMRSWDRIGSKSGVVAQFSILRKRDLRCFVLKKSFAETQLGTGVAINFGRGRQGELSSEFDLLSKAAFDDHFIRQSVMGLPFDYFLPLPINQRHYNAVKDEVITSLAQLGQGAQLPSTAPSDVVISFMNDIVVKLCSDTKGVSDASALGRASERAIESYYHLFHLLLCLATSNTGIVRAINMTVSGLLQAKPRSDKTTIPNLGHLLIALLLTDHPVTEKVLKNVIQEAIARNVVWMLDRQKGSGMVELAYLEADPISYYRLKKTFEASRTSYTLLMFQNLFRQTIDRGTGTARKSLVTMRDELFQAHGGPPKGTAEALAKKIGELQAVDNFKDFVQHMGVALPSQQFFTSFLRGCTVASVEKGYSRWGIGQEEAYRLRIQRDPTVQARLTFPDGIAKPKGPATVESFFPSGGGGRGGGRGGRGGRGRGRGGRGRGGYGH